GWTFHKRGLWPQPKGPYAGSFSFLFLLIFLFRTSSPLTKEKEKEASREKEDEIVANVNDPDRYWHNGGFPGPDV
ncbi:MAG: hypothetical protein ACREF9_01155, partial [Opitutaceae bacterium]